MFNSEELDKFQKDIDSFRAYVSRAIFTLCTFSHDLVALFMVFRNRNGLPSCGDDHLSKRSSKRIASSRMDNTNNDKLDTDTFELYMEYVLLLSFSFRLIWTLGFLICCYNFVHRDLWERIDEDKKSAYAYFDSMWFYMYNSGNNEPNILKWIKAKKIFSRRYVFVPIICW
jgi:hypothetical protein